MVMLQRWPILMEGEWSCYRSGHFIGGRMVMLPMWSVLWREDGHVTEVVTLMEVGSLKEGEWSCYRGGQFNGENGYSMEVTSLMEGEWSLQRRSV